MPATPPPNKALADLAHVLGDDNVRTLTRTFLRDFPQSIKELTGGERANRHRVAHSMKSSSRLMGILDLSQRMLELELRLASETGRDVTPEDIATIKAEFEQAAVALKKFVGD